MESIPWFAWIPIIAIVAWGITEAIKALAAPRGKASDELAGALRANTDANAKVAERLDGIEQRLSTIEKTLSDIP